MKLPVVHQICSLSASSLLYLSLWLQDDMPMWYAVNGGGDAVLKVVLSHGVDINAKNSRVPPCPSALLITHAWVICIDTKPAVPTCMLHAGHQHAYSRHE